jgi:hypothetical protein
MASPVCSDVWWQEWCGRDRPLGNRHIALGFAGTENHLQRSNLLSLPSVRSGRGAHGKGCAGGGQPGCLEKTALSADEAAEQAHAAPIRPRARVRPCREGRTTGTWDDRAVYWLVVVHGSPLGHEGLSKWNPQWHDLADSRTESWLHLSHFALRSPDLRSVALLC